LGFSPDNVTDEQRALMTWGDMVLLRAQASLK
jgi:hypothetical protein